jgi:2-polyprenyl-6-hydroxyphenyl methylase/3-demethylubiquinone-9 3-methyltransferase
MSNSGDEIRSGKRFAFGENWKKFLAVLDDERIGNAVSSLKALLGAEDLKGKTFLDVGSGSGLFSLAARRLGAQVHSFDYDSSSVECTKELKARFQPGDIDWRIEQGSILDNGYLDSLGQFDVVYSWGVLHHTGAMWVALENAARLVGPKGLLAVALYNDQGGWSRRWTAIKKTYNRLPGMLRIPFTAIVMGTREIPQIGISAIRGDIGSYIRSWSDYSAISGRGMSRWHDMLDWIGGYPFEVSRPEQVLDFLRNRGFSLEKLRTEGGGLGCNEFLFSRDT